MSNKGSLRLVAVSGAEEIGMNMTIYSFEKDNKNYNLLVDCGISFGDFPGAGVVMPNLPELMKNGMHIDAIILTHGHEDHIGALPYLLEMINAPMYATPFTCGLIKNKLTYVSRDRFAKKPNYDFKLNKVELGQTLNIGPFSIQWIATPHSIPDSAMLAIEVDGKRVLHTGDWKLDPNPVVGQTIDYKSLQAFGKKGVHALIGDSTNIHEEETANSEGEVADALKELVKNTKTGKFVLTCFASNVARVKSCIEAANEAGRSVLLLGSSLKKAFVVATELGYLDAKNVIDEDQVGDIPSNKLMVICTGSQAEENSALWKIANKMRTAGTSLDMGDTIVFSARVIDGNQHNVRKVINELVERGVRVLHPWNSRESCIHASGHPAKPDIKQLLEWVKPNYVIPVHCEAEHRISHIAFARSLGFKTFNLRNCVIIEISEEKIEKIGSLKVEKLVYDGKRLIPDQSFVFKERKEMNDNGLISVSIGYKGKNLNAFVTCYGLFDKNVDLNNNQIHYSKIIKSEVEKVVKKFSVADFQAANAVKKEVITAVRNCAYRYVSKNPAVICHIIS